MGIWAWLIGAFGGCKHEWDETFETSGVLYRCCMSCDRLEKFEPDVGGWTAGHWDEVKS